MQYTFQHSGIRGDLGKIQTFKHHSCGFQSLVMAENAVLIDERGWNKDRCGM
jgi:hypothetical protein